MAQTTKSTISISNEQKKVVKQTRSQLEDELGVRPTLAETVVIACERLDEAEA